MKKSLVATLTLSALFLGACGGSSSTDTTDDVTVIEIPDGATGTGAAAYGTNPLHVAVGTKVKWHNADSMSHTATSTGNWDTGVIGAGEDSSTVTIDAAGTYDYFCDIHGSGSMSGQIIAP